MFPDYWVLSRDPCDNDIYLYLVTGGTLAMLPYWLALWKLGTGDAQDIYRGLALSKAWSVVCLVYSSYHLLVVATSARPALTAKWELAGWGLFAIAQAALVASVSRAARSVGGGPDRAASAWIYAPHVALYALLVFMVVATTSTMLIRQRISSLQGAAVGNLRDINSAQTEYEQTHPETGYASSLLELRTAEMITETLATGLDRSYRFTLKAGPPRSSGRILTYAALAEPAFRPRGTCPSYFTNETATIHFTLEDRPAIAEDPLLQ